MTNSTEIRAVADGGARGGAGGTAMPHDGARTLTLPLPLPSPLLTINQRQKWHWTRRANETAKQRVFVGWFAKGHLPADALPLRGRVRIDVAIYPHPRQKEPDMGGKWEAAKAWIDGLQDAGVFEEGDDRVVEHGAFAWHKDQRRGEMVLTLTEVSDG